MRRARAVALTVVLGLAACGRDEPAPATVQEAAPEADVATTGASPGCDDPRVREPGTREVTIDTEEGERELLLSVPSGYDGARPAPLVLSFHGLGSEAAQQVDYTGLVDRALEAGVVVASPEGGGTPARWRLPDDGAGEDVGFVTSMLDRLGGELCLDLDRTFAVGLSNGAAFSAVLGCELAEHVAGVGAVAGVNLVAACPDDEPVPLVAFHGTDDDIVPYGGGSVLFGLAQARPVVDAVADWAERNRCDAEPVDEVEGEIRHRRYEGCAEGAGVELFVVDGGGHTWPGAREVTGLGHVTDQIDATEILFERFGLG
jgi:polyhydroxybutyrate depolymerase